VERLRWFETGHPDLASRLPTGPSGLSCKPLRRHSMYRPTVAEESRDATGVNQVALSPEN